MRKHNRLTLRKKETDEDGNIVWFGESLWLKRIRGFQGWSVLTKPATRQLRWIEVFPAAEPGSSKSPGLDGGLAVPDGGGGGSTEAESLGPESVRGVAGME